MARIGIMQGRLTAPVRGIQAFPRDHWRDELIAAQSAQMDFIEWIFDAYGADVNPLMTAAGIAEMKALMTENHVAVDAICADYFMDFPLLKCSASEHAERMVVFESMMAQAKLLGVNRVVLPFVDASALSSAAEEAAFIALMKSRVLPLAEKLAIEMHMETSLPPDGVARVLAHIPHPLFWINYDAGNSASLGFKPADEFAAYGKHIGSFHIKDRVLGSTTVPLGTGDTDFAALKEGLIAVGYHRSYVLQVARGEVGDEIAWARANRKYAETHLIP